MGQRQDSASVPGCEDAATVGASGTVDSASDYGRFAQSGPAAQWITLLTMGDLGCSHSRSSNYADIAFLPSARHQKCPLLPFLYLQHEGRVAFPEYL